MWTLFGPFMSAGVSSGRLRSRRFQLTERDLAMAAFVDRVGRATVAQMRERFGLSGRVCWRRLQALREAGLVQTALGADV